MGLAAGWLSVVHTSEDVVSGQGHGILCGGESVLDLCSPRH